MDTYQRDKEAAMRLRRTIGMILGLVATAAVAGEAKVNDSFVIDAPYDEVVEWIDAHQNECRAAMNVTLVSADEGLLTLRRANRRGQWLWQQRDTITRQPGRWHLESTLVECLEGGIEAFASDVTIVQDGGRSRVSAATFLDVEGIATKELKIDMHGRARRLRELLEREVAR